MSKLLSYQGDIFIPPLDLWLDPGRIKSKAFVSHAHADHSGRHKTIFSSSATAKFLEYRLRVNVGHIMEYGKPEQIQKGTLTLFPSGHILGSSQALIEYNDVRLAYTGDFKLIPSRTAEPCKILDCDHLVMECTYGRPQYRFPDRAKVEQDLLDHVQSILQQKKTPVILAYALGRSQEMIKLFSEEGFSLAVENRIFDITEIYRNSGIEFGKYERFNPMDYHDRVLIFPPHLWKSPVLGRIRDKHTVAVTGWAMDNRQSAWYQSDKSFPLSDHADFDDLMHYIEVANPKVVSLIHGFKEFAEHIKKIGIKIDIEANLI